MEKELRDKCWEMAEKRGLECEWDEYFSDLSSPFLEKEMTDKEFYKTFTEFVLKFF